MSFNLRKEVFNSSHVDGFSLSNPNQLGPNSIQENIYFILSSISTISQISNIPSHIDEESEKEINRKLVASKSLALETQKLLDEYISYEPVDLNEKSQRKLIHQKLCSNFQHAIELLEKTAQNFLIQEKRKIKKLHPGYSTDINIPSTGNFYDPTQPSTQSTHIIDIDNNTDTYTANKNDSPTSSLLQSFANNQSQLANEQLKQKSALEKDFIEEKYLGVSRIHRDILGIHEMYKELNWQANLQGEVIENIESLLNESSKITKSALINVEEARESRSAHSQIWLIPSLIVFIALVILIVILVIKFH